MVVGSGSVCTTNCSDGIILGGETCDDLNANAGDGCSDTCQDEIGFVCVGEPSVCTLVVCGDDTRYSTEECDDGNTVAGDGCSDLCVVECDQDEYKDSSFTCIKCTTYDASCTACDASTCSACLEGFTLTDGKCSKPVEQVEDECSNKSLCFK